MGLFFWISGRMSAHSLSRSPPLQFVRRKVVRLGIPTVVYTVLLNPLVWGLAIIVGKSDENVVGEAEANWKRLVGYWRGLRGVKGVVWYCAVLLIFDCVSAFSLSIFRPRKARIELKDDEERERSSSWTEVIYRSFRAWGWLLVAAISFFVRIWYPVGVVLDPLCIQVAYLPQYVFAYTMGVLSLGQGEERFTGPFDRLLPLTLDITSTSALETGVITQRIQPKAKENRTALPLRRALAISFLTLPLCGIIPKLWARCSGQPLDPSSNPTAGGLSPSALTYAFWNEFSFIVLGPSVMFYFQNHYDRPAKSWLWQPRFSYGSYLLHPLVSVGVEVGVDGLLCRENGWCRSDAMWWSLFVGPFVFTTVVGCMNASVAFAVARGLVGYVPGMKKIL
jgi:hypothetical protein